MPGDMLESIFQMQADLNDYVFSKNQLENKAGAALTMAQIAKAVGSDALGVNDLPNQWISRYCQAMESELDELRSDLLWKWWSKDRIDIQNIRVELVDLLHFLVSSMIAAGMTADKVHDVYKQKHQVNLARQNAGYSQATKTEDDNRTIS